jgi:sulfur-oxidizing protein SoxY
VSAASVNGDNNMVERAWRATRLSRRKFIGAIALGLASPFPVRRAAQATAESAAAAIKAIVGDAALREGKISLDIPPIAENGNSVPVTVSVDSPMTATDHVRSIHVFAEANPRPNVAHFHLGPRAGRAQVSTRIRLFTSQKIVAIAALSDESFWSGSAEVVITLAACIEE